MLSFIMEDQEAPRPLKSLHSDEPTYVTFDNKSNGKARAWWLNFEGKPVSYGDIKPGEGLEMNTFMTHPWIFRAENGAKLQANFEDVYFPTPPQYGEDGFPEFVPVIVSVPVYSLQEYCALLIRKLVRSNDVAALDIPEFLRQELRQPPSLARELELLNASREAT